MQQEAGQVEQTIRSFHRMIDDLQDLKDVRKPVSVLQAVTDKLSEGQLGLVAALHHEDRLKRLLQAVNKCVTFSEAQLQKLNAFAKPFLQGMDMYRKVYDSLRAKCDLEAEYKFERVFNHFEQRKATLTKLLEVTSKKGDSFERAKQVNNFIDEVLFPLTEHSQWDQCLLSWMRMHTEATLRAIYQSAKVEVTTLCCRLHFRARERIEGMETIYQSFQYQVEEAGSMANLKRNMISFLNSVKGSTASGGFHYYGVNHRPQQGEVEMEGVGYDAKLKQAILHQVREVIKQIEPIENVDEDATSDEEEEEISKFDNKVNEMIKKTLKDVRQNYQLTTLIEVDFLNIYDPDTLLYTRSYQGLDLVVPRVKVFTGDPYDVYFCVNEKDMPEPYYRKGRKEEKLSVQEFYDELYRKLRKRADDGIEDKYGEVKFHNLCRFKGKN